MEITKRLESIAKCVKSGAVVADIGTDHGYVPIYLVKSGISQKTYAMDINKGPLEKASENIRRYGVTDQVTTILSNGLVGLEDTSVDTVIIAGMGGMLIANILEAGEKQLAHTDNLILSPHLDVEVVRRKVHSLGYKIVEEQMLTDEDKDYNILVCQKGSEAYETDESYRFGALLLEAKNPVLKASIIKKQGVISKILADMAGNNSCHVIARREELEKDLNKLTEVLRHYDC